MFNLSINNDTIAVMKRLQDLFLKYEHYLSPMALIGGFIFDNLTLRRIDLLVDNLLMLAYLFIAYLIIFFFSAYNAGRLRGRAVERFADVAPYILQFVFGGLFSAFVVFYLRSASLLTSWPFIICLAILLIGNEVFRERYLRLVFRLSIFFIALFSYSILVLPILLHKMGAKIFLLSGFVSLILIGLVIYSLFTLMPGRPKLVRKILLTSVGGIYVAFNILYFANIIPPIPLSLKESGIYHSVVRTAGGYEVRYEPPPWYLFFKDFNPTFHWAPGSRVYSYSAVFAPTKLNTTILHRWLYYDKNKKQWVEMDRLQFPIFGGRDGGYRGYTLKTNVKPGKWRIDVITERGQLLGRMNFRIVQVDFQPELKFRLQR